MELNNPDRNRKAGFLGVTIATLLTPGGKLFTSALAAVTVAGGLISTKLAHEETSPTPSATPTVLPTSDTVLDESNLPELTEAYDTLSAPAVGFASNASLPSGLTMQSMSSLNVAAVDSMNTPPSNIEIADWNPLLPPPLFKDPVKPECVVVPPEELDNIKLAEGQVICESDDSKTGNKSEPGPQPELVADASGGGTQNGGSGGGGQPNEPVLLVDPVVGPGPQDLPLPRGPFGPELVPEAPQYTLSALTPSAVSAPSTLGLLLLGLANLGWLYRKRAADRG